MQPLIENILRETIGAATTEHVMSFSCKKAAGQLIAVKKTDSRFNHLQKVLLGRNRRPSPNDD